MNFSVAILFLAFALGASDMPKESELVSSSGEVIVQDQSDSQKLLTSDEIVKEANKLFETKDKTPAEKAHLVRAYLKSLEIHWIDVDLAKQHLECWEKNKSIKSMSISAARGKTYLNSVEPKGKVAHNHQGVFQIYLRQRKHWSKEYEVWMYHNSFFHNGHVIHDCRRENFRMLGKPASHGCVRTPPKQNPYSWTKIGDIVFCHH